MPAAPAADARIPVPGTGPFHATRDALVSAADKGRGGGTLLPLALGLMVLVSAVAVVQVKQHNRELTTHLDGLRQDQQGLQLEWSQLQLEQATLAQHGRVDELARKQFGLVDPLDYQIVQGGARPAPSAEKPQ